MLDRIYIEISNICNLQCTFCPVVERDKKVMSVVDFEQTLIQAKPLAKQICLHLMGEPLAHPEFPEILKKCEEYEVKIQLTTNGLYVKKYAQILTSPAIAQINFSVQSYRDNFPHKNLADYLIPLMEFTKFLEEKNPNTYINYRMWNIGTESTDNEEMFRLIESFYQVNLNRHVDVASIKSKKVTGRIYLHFDSRFDWPSLNLPFQGTIGRCHGMTGHIGIHADGTVVPCCLDKEAIINLGNIHQNPLSDILNTQRAKAMRDGFNQNRLVESLCQHCTYIQRFKA